MIVGIDIGTQSLKAVLLTADLKIAGQASRSYQPTHLGNGRVEQDPFLWAQAIGPAIAEALASADSKPSDVKALGICGQLDGCVPVDKDGHALSACVTWMDRRAKDEIADISPDHIRAIAGLVLDPSHLAAKARWLKRHLARASSIARFHQPVSYMVELLTGEAIIDRALASTSMVYSLPRSDYDDNLLEQFELRRSELPKIARAEGAAGKLHRKGAEITGLPEGTIVAVGTGDDFSTPLGAGLHQPGKAVAVLGTAEVVGALHPSPLIDEGGLVETHAYPGGAFFIENPGWASGGAITWLTHVLNEPDLGTLNSLAAEIAPGSDALTFLPALSGAMAPEWQPDARGCFYGLTPAHGQGHLFRAVLEGCAFAMRDVIDRLASMGVTVDSLLLLGGGARSKLWTQIRANILQRPVEVPSNLDSAPIGAGLLAIVAAGLFPNLGEAIKVLPTTSTMTMPDPRQAEPYDEAYQRYRNLFQALKPLFIS